MIKIQLAGIEFFKMHKQLAPMNEKFLDLEKKITQNSKELAQYEAETTKKEQALLAIEDKLKKEQAKQREIENAINSFEKQILLNKQQITNNKNKLEDNHERIKVIDLQKESGSDVLEKEHKKLEDTKVILSLQKEQAEKLVKKLAEIKEKVSALYQENDEIYHKINEFQSKKQKILNEKNELETRQRLITEQLNRITDKIEDYQNKYEKFCELVTEHEKKQAQSTLTLQKLREKKITLEKSIEDIKEKEQKLLDESHDFLLQIKTHENEKQQLIEWERNFAGYSDGTKALLEKFRDKKLTTLAENISVKEKYVGLVEQALRNILLSAICEEQDIQDIISFLQKEKLTSQLIIKKTEHEKNTQIIKIENATPLAEIITLKNEIVHHKLLENYYIVENRDIALSLISQHQNEDHILHFITKDGEIYSNRGVVTTHWIDTSSKGLLSRKAELGKIDKNISNLQSEHAQILHSIEEITKKKSEITEQIKILAKDITSKSDVLEKEQKQLINITIQKDNFQELVRDNKQQFAGIETQRSEVITGLKSVEVKLDEIPEHEEKALQQKLESVQTTLKTIRKEQYRFEKLVNDQKIEITKLDKDIAYINQNIIRINETALSNEQELEKLQNSIEPLKKDIENLQKETEKLEISFKKKVDELHTFKDKNVSIENEFHELRKELDTLKMKLHDFEFKKEVFSRDKNEIELKIQETKLKIEHLKEDVIQHYHHDLSHDTAEDYEELGPAELQTDREKQEKRLENLGPINLAAINDYETQKKRLEFLNEQRKDLVDSKTNLQEAISQLNETAEKMFMNTFTIIQKNFNTIYKEIFNGGKGVLKLENPSDPLNSKIEIYSNPKGKKITNITLLSSGEKALTAIALLFSIYLVKPSPFCILDEIDAPLDDSNVGRFLKLVNKFSIDTQFLIITHNKRTIEAVDYLYGITMEEDGVSKIVSVKLD